MPQGFTQNTQDGTAPALQSHQNPEIGASTPVCPKPEIRKHPGRSIYLCACYQRKHVSCKPKVFLGPELCDPFQRPQLLIKTELNPKLGGTTLGHTGLCVKIKRFTPKTPPKERQEPGKAHLGEGALTGHPRSTPLRLLIKACPNLGSNP